MLCPFWPHLEHIRVLLDIGAVEDEQGLVGGVPCGLECGVAFGLLTVGKGQVVSAEYSSQ